jgi:predicted nucleic acid-binding protein
MSADFPQPSFTDTNIFVYAIASDDTVRSPIAQELIRTLMLNGSLRTSTQVLGELYTTLTQKAAQKLTPAQALRYMDQIAAFPVIGLDYAGVRAAVELCARHKFSYWDAQIVIAASRAGAARLYSEDMQHGRVVLGVEIVNPFREAPR